MVRIENRSNIKEIKSILLVPQQNIGSPNLRGAPLLGEAPILGRIRYPKADKKRSPLTDQ